MRIALPARLHDPDKLYTETGIKTQELHLSFAMKLIKENKFSHNLLIEYSIHLPDYLDSETLVDFFSEVH